MYMLNRKGPRTEPCGTRVVDGMSLRSGRGVSLSLCKVCAGSGCYHRG